MNNHANVSNKKWALLVGITTYPCLSPWQQLQGCLNDVSLMTDTLQSIFGFPDEQMVILRNEQATRDSILRTMNDLVAHIGIDDIVVFYYSGHGSRVRDREGDEVDGWDETIMPYDAGRSPYPFRDITDDELYLWLFQLTQKTPYVTLIFDSCHSGDITRDSFGDAARWVASDERPLQELPPSPVPAEQLPLLLAGTRNVGPSGWLPKWHRYVLLAGCRHDERSYESRLGEIVYGAMTYSLNQELLNIAPGTTYRDVFERVSLLVSSRTQDRQHPQIEGACDREIFGVRDIIPMRFVSVKQRNGDSVLLNAGLAHNLTAGSQWAIYPQSTKNITEDTSCLGLIEVSTPRGVTSEAHVISEAFQGSVTPQTRAVEITHDYGNMRLHIHLDDGTEDTQLKQVLEASSSLLLAETSKDAEVQVYLVQPRIRATAVDPVPQLGAISEATWAVVGRTGQLLMPLHLQREGQAVYLLRDNLEKMARYNNILNLRNRSSQDMLRDKIDMRLLKRNIDGSWIEAEQDPVHKHVVYQDGEAIAISVINSYHDPVYCCILDLGLAGTVTQLHPNPGSNKALTQGYTLVVGVRPGDEISLYIPTFQNAGIPIAIKELETLKLIATTHEADFSLFAQGIYRGVTDTTDDSLAQLLQMVWTGTRDTMHANIQVADAWTTVERSFLLLPAS